MFPVRGHMEAGNTRLNVDGAVADLFKPSSMEGKVRLAGSSLAGLRPFVPAKLPRSRPYEVQAQLSQKGEATSTKDVRIKIGGTLLTGNLSYDRSGERPLLKAAAFPAPESLKVTAELMAGVLSLKPVDVGIAQGHAARQPSSDGRTAEEKALARSE